MPNDSMVDEMMSLIQMHGSDAIPWNFCQLKKMHMHGFVIFFYDMKRLFLSSPQKISMYFLGTIVNEECWSQA